MSITGIIFNQKKVVFQNQSNALSLLASGPSALQNISNVLQGNLIGQTAGIVVDATLTESHVLSSEVTMYPVEDGSTISDHVQLKPLVYNMTGVISDTPIGFLILGDVGSAINSVQKYFGSGRSQEAYYAIFNLWKSRAPFTVTTNLKRYENMIFTSFIVDDDVDTSNEINFKATLQQVTIVTSQSTSSQGQNLSSNTKISQTGQSTVNNGQQTTNPTEEQGSGAHKMFGGFFHH